MPELERLLSFLGVDFEIFFYFSEKTGGFFEKKNLKKIFLSRGLFSEIILNYLIIISR